MGAEGGVEEGVDGSGLTGGLRRVGEAPRGKPVDSKPAAPYRHTWGGVLSEAERVEAESKDR
jgi:hypothetical protein